MRRFIVSGCTILAVVSCGKPQGEKRAEVSTGSGTLSSSSLSDLAVEGEVAGALASEALASAASGEANSTSLSLTHDDDHDTGEFTRKCEIQSDGSALVTVTSSLNRSFSKEKGKRSVSVTLSGKGKQSRVWSLTGKTLECKSDHFHFENALKAGLKLQLETERSREFKRVVTTAKGAEKTLSKSFSLKAKRTVEWVAINDTADALVRQKKISSVEAARSIKVEGAKSGDIDTTIKVKVGTEGLIVTVKRDPGTRELTSKLIESGEVIATLDDGGEVKTSFKNLLFSVSEGKCALESGSFSSISKPKDSEARAAITCNADAELTDDGKLQCTDASGEVVEVEPPLCDPEDAA